MGIKFSNNGHSTLAASISSSDTSITVASGHGSRFPSLAAGDYFYATLIDASNNLEIVKCTARSSDVLTVTRGAESTTARAYAIGDRIELRVTAAGLDEAAQIYDKDSTSTGYFDLPAGTTAQAPAAGTGRVRFDTDLGVVMFSDGSDWYKIAAAVAQLSSVSGIIYDGAASTLTLTGSGFLTSNLVVNFTQSSDGIDEDVTVTPTSDTSATVAVPSSVYSNVTAGNVVSVQVTNSDGMSSAAVSKTALGTPSGGTVTTSGSYRIHTFTSSGTFTVPSGLSLSSVEYVVVAGGGAGGGSTGSTYYGGGGGGAGGYRSSVSGENSGGGAGTESALSLSAGNYTVTVGAGGATRATNGSNSVFHTVTSLGGGYGGEQQGGTPPNSGGSGGGAGRDGGNGGVEATGASGTSGQGYRGGNSTDAGCNSGGGGGGAGQAGYAGGYDCQNHSGTVAQGGAGVASSIRGTSEYRAGGGGGDWWGSGATNNNRPLGGAGGGGNGANANRNIQGTSGSTNSGGGGGGGDGRTSSSSPGAGGSGVVIVRYAL